jgi:hypothetical protein
MMSGCAGIAPADARIIFEEEASYENILTLQSAGELSKQRGLVVTRGRAFD